MDLTLEETLVQSQSSLDACVIVGGSLIWKRREQLENCLQRGVRLRILFPDPDSEWLVKMVSSVGMSIEDYSPRILKSAKIVQQFDQHVEIRWFTTAITNWFLIVDRKLVWHKMFSLTEKTAKQIVYTQQGITYYNNLFDSIWEESKDTLTLIPEHTGNEPESLAEPLSWGNLADLLELLVNRFGEDELRTICFYLEVDYEILPATGKLGKVRELLTYLERRNRIIALIEVGRKLRPDIDWPPYSNN